MTRKISEASQFRNRKIAEMRQRLAKFVGRFGRQLHATMHGHDYLQGIPTEDRGGLEMPRTVNLTEKEYDILVMLLTKIALKHGEYLGYDGSGAESAPTQAEIANTLTDGELEHIDEAIDQFIG